MSDVYLIKKETLTTIADVIREVSPNDYPEGTTITPEEVGSTAIYSVYNQGYTDGKAENEKVTDLKGKTYYIPSGWEVTAGYGKILVNCDIVVGEVTHTGTRFSLGYTVRGGAIKSFSPSANNITIDSGSDIAITNYYKFDNTQAFTITFNDGYTTHSDLINWVTTWGKAGSYDEGYNDGVNSALVEFADWSLSATSHSCTVSIVNTHPSMYLHLDFFVEEWESVGDSYEASVVVPPNSSYSWDSGDWVDSTPSGAEWDIYIESMRFSTDGV